MHPELTSLEGLNKGAPPAGCCEGGWPAVIARWSAEVTALTDHQAKLFAFELQRRHPAGNTARIGSALMDAQVDLNPHQVDAALFAFRSPFSKGVILADKVGLGRTTLRQLMTCCAADPG